MYYYPCLQVSQDPHFVLLALASRTTGSASCSMVLALSSRITGSAACTFSPGFMYHRVCSIYYLALASHTNRVRSMYYQPWLRVPQGPQHVLLALASRTTGSAACTTSPGFTYHRVRSMYY
jgi:hypothetical protein